MKPIFRKLISLMLTLTFLLALTSCGGSDGTGMSFVYPIPSEPSTLDPQVCSDSAALTAVTNLYEGLVRIGSDGAVIPGAAEKMKVSDNGLVYTFRLRSGLKWHLIDNFSGILGETFKESFDASLTSRDFVFGLRRALSPATSSPEASSLYVIKNAEAVREGRLPVTSLGVAAPDERTLVITLSSPCVDFLSLLAQPVSMPCSEAFFNACKGKYGKGLEYTMCNGPFYLSKWNGGSSLLLKRNPDYVGGSDVLPYSVTLSVYPDESGYVKAVAEGRYDAAFAGAGTALSSGFNGMNVAEYKNTVYSLCFNCADETLSNLYIRLALCSSFDRSQLGISESFAAASGLLPSCCRTGGESYRERAGSADFVAYNSEKASSYWNTGLTSLGQSSVKLTVLCSSENEKTVLRLLQFWQQSFGISVTVTAQVVEPVDLQKAVAGGNYQIALAPVTASSVSAAASLTEYSPESGKNIFGFFSDAYGNIVHSAFRAGSSSSAAEGCRTAESFLMQNGVVYPFYEISEHLVFAGNVSGIYANPAGTSVCFASAVKKD